MCKRFGAYRVLQGRVVAVRGLAVLGFGISVAHELL